MLKQKQDQFIDAKSYASLFFENDQSLLKNIDSTLEQVLQIQIKQNNFDPFNVNNYENFSNIKTIETEVSQLTLQIKENLSLKDNEVIFEEVTIQDKKSIPQRLRNDSQKSIKQQNEKLRKKYKQKQEQKYQDHLFQKRYKEYFLKKNKIDSQEQDLYLIYDNQKQSKIKMEGFLSQSFYQGKDFGNGFFSDQIFKLFNEMQVQLRKYGDQLRKGEIIGYFLDRMNLFKIFDYDPLEFIKNILSFETEEPNHLIDNEFMQFLSFPHKQENQDKITNFKNLNPHHKISIFEYFFFLENHIIEQLEMIFIKINSKKRQSGNMIVSFIENFHKDYQNIDLMNQVVYYIKPINRLISLSQILIDLRGDILNSNQIFVGVDFNIISDWDYILHYIENYIFQPIKKNLNFQSFAKFNTIENDKIDFPHMDKIKDIFDSLENYHGFVYKQEFILGVLNDSFLDSQMGKSIRKNKGFKYGEKLHELISRIEKETEDYISFDEIEQFFSRRGIPILIVKYYQFNEKNENQEKEQKYLFQLPDYQSRKNHLQKIWSVKHFEKIFGKEYKNSLNCPKITRPQNFNFTEQKDKQRYCHIYQDYIKNQKEEEIQKELDFKFVPLKVPKNTFYNIYQQMVEEAQFKQQYWIQKRLDLQSKREQLKYNRQDDKFYEDQNSETYQFKARPNPKCNKIPLYQTLIEDPLQSKKLRTQNMREIIKEKKINQQEPNFSFMPKRFQKYAKEKYLKQMYYRNMSLQEKDPNFTFCPKIGKTINSSYREYFDSLHQQLEDKLNQKKILINEQVEEKFINVKPFNFTSNFSNRKNTHNCFKNQGVIKKPITYDFRKILYNSMSVPPSTTKFDQMKEATLERKRKLERERQQRKQRYKPKYYHDYDMEIDYLQNKIIPKKFVERNVLLEENEYEDCEYDQIILQMDIDVKKKYFIKWQYESYIKYLVSQKVDDFEVEKIGVNFLENFTLCGIEKADKKKFSAFYFEKRRTKNKSNHQ